MKTVKVARELQVPYFEAELEAFNMSPHLDVHVRGVGSWLMAFAERAAEIFATLDDWRGFDVPRGESRAFGVTYWLNEYQMAVVSTYVRERLTVQLYVRLHAESRVGAVNPFKILEINIPPGQ